MIKSNIYYVKYTYVHEDKFKKIIRFNCFLLQTILIIIKIFFFSGELSLENEEAKRENEVVRIFNFFKEKENIAVLSILLINYLLLITILIVLLSSSDK